MKRYFIRLSYCGKNYNGWQNQPHKKYNDCSGAARKSFIYFLRVHIDLTGCGRTDTGVHARDYYAHMDVEQDLDVETLVYRINKMLPNDIAVHAVIPVHDTAHARFDATSRSYEYHLHTYKSPFIHHSYFYPYGNPDIDLLNQAAGIILQYQDFNTFCKTHSDVKTTLCKVTESKWSLSEGQYIYRITSDRFLRGMIRLICGMCLNVARGQIDLSHVHDALRDKKRVEHDWSVPADGLVLCDIKYPYML
ncbi:MAG: tRNA pseudouridine synthase A [Saprospiraceae bacterium]|nr:tRNA pseudouridine synthase A [Saprospiraceae bacterium]